MRVRSLVVTTTIATAAAVSMLIGAPAFAATSPSSVTVSACNPATPSATVSTSSVSWTSSTDTLSVTNDCSTGGSSTMIQVWTVQGSAQLLKATVTNGSTATTSALGSDVTALRIYEFTGGFRGALLATVTATSPSTGGGSGGGSGDTASDTSASSAPPAIIQQFGKDASLTCDAAAPASLNWANVPSGGWGESWAEWMNDGKGGAVCTRMLLFNSSSGTWVLG